MSFISSKVCQAKFLSYQNLKKTAKTYAKSKYFCLDLRVSCRQAKELFNHVKNREHYLGQIVSFHYSDPYDPNKEWPLMSNNFLDKYNRQDTIFFKIDLTEPNVNLEEAVQYIKKKMVEISSLWELTSSHGVAIDDKDNQRNISFFPSCT